MRADRIGPLALTARDLAATHASYTRVLGMREVTLTRGRKALGFGDQKLSLHQQSREIEPNASNPTPGSADLCFLTSVSVHRVVEHLCECDVPIVEGPVQHTGATGSIMSAYSRDPDGNLIEVPNPEATPEDSPTPRTSTDVE